LAINHAIMLKLGSEAAGEGAEIVVSWVRGDSDAVRNQRRLSDHGISCRETSWQPISKEEVRVAHKYLGYECPLEAREYVYPSDGASNFIDCGFWYVIADRASPPLAPIRPYATYVNDCLQRYVPEMLGGGHESGFITMARRSELALCATPFTRDDLIQYVGLPARKVVLVPPVFNPIALPPDPAPPPASVSRGYLLWLTDLAPQGNHEVVLRGIRRYFERLAGQLDVVVSDFQRDGFNFRGGEDSPYVRGIRSHLEKSGLLTHRIHWLGTLDHDQYAHVLGAAAFLFHPCLIDGGTSAPADAAALGVPTLSNDYPAMRFWNRELRLEISFFDAMDDNAIATALKDAEDGVSALKRRLPIPADLARFGPDKVAPPLWNVVREYV
jgi:glycosyltransferase involved in cell wall biosynthesis